MCYQTTFRKGKRLVDHSVNSIYSPRKSSEANTSYSNKKVQDKAKANKIFQLIVFMCLILGVTAFLIYLGSKSLPRIDWDIVKDKRNSYECRYSDLSELRCLYSLQFYVIRLSFIIFDLEVLLIIPILVSLAVLSHSLLLARSFLRFILILLFLEIKVRVLDW